MIGLLLVTHCDIGRELMRASELILGSLEGVDYISITALLEPEELMNTIKEKLKMLDRGSGVLVLTDMFGGTPCNITIPFFQEDKVEIVTGVNLPMLIAIANKRDKVGLRQIAEEAASVGREKIYLMGSLFPKR